MIAIQCMKPLVKWRSQIIKSISIFKSVNLNNVCTYKACKPKVHCFLQYAVPLQIKNRQASSKTSARTEDKLRIADGIPPDYELIYRAPMNSYVTAIQGISSVLSCAFIVAGIFKYFSVNFNEKAVTVNETTATLMLTDEQFLIMAVTFVIVNLSLQIFASKFPLRIYSNESDSYIATYVSLLPSKIRQVKFRAGSVMKLPPSGIMPWGASWFKINNKGNIILEHYFRKPIDLHSMLKEK